MTVSTIESKDLKILVTSFSRLKVGYNEVQYHDDPEYLTNKDIQGYLNRVISILDKYDLENNEDTKEYVDKFSALKEQQKKYNQLVAEDNPDYSMNLNEYHLWQVSLGFFERIYLVADYK